MKYIFLFIALTWNLMAFAQFNPSANDRKHLVLLSEQSDSRVAIADVRTQQIVWEWKPSAILKPEHVKWFSNMSDAKSVMKGTHILATASGGGIALIRLSDKKTIFYTYVGGNTHSAELLPDGNLVSASSTGSYLTLIRLDTVADPEQVKRKNIPLDFAHNVVWDVKSNRLWSAARKSVHSYRYQSDDQTQNLIQVDSISMPGVEGHDLYPDPATQNLWLTNTTDVYRFNIPQQEFLHASDFMVHEHVKSVSSGNGKPTIVIKPKTSWWTDEVLDKNGKRVFYMAGLKIYKARWL